MKFGIAVPHFSRLGQRETIVEIARETERLGYDSLWTTDHVLMARGQEEPYGHIYEAVTTLAYLAALTERVELGISVIVFPQREPVLVAKQVATLDALSGGRLILGVGAGWNRVEFEFLGAEFNNRGKRFDEYLRLLRELWTAPEPSFEGQFARVKDALFSPRPVRAGGVPILIGGSSPAALRRVATLADGWHPVGISVEGFASGMQRIAELAGGRRILGTARLRIGIDQVLPERRSASGQIQASVSGSLQQVVDQLAAYRAAGVEHLVLNFSDESPRHFLTDLERFAADARPKLA